MSSTGMETGERITRGQVFIKHQSWLLLAEDTLDVARLLFRVVGPVNDANLDQLKLTTAFLFVRAFRSAHGCCKLFADGYEHESYIPLRTVFEHLVDLSYLERNPSEADDFWNYAAIGHHRYVQTAQKYLRNDPLPSEYLENVQEGYERVKGRYPSELRWSKKNLADRAATVGLEEQYRFIYQMCSEYCHTGPMTYRRHFVEGETNVHVQLGPEAPEDPTALALLVTTLI